MTLAALYLRKSTQDERTAAHGRSLDRRREHAIAYAKWQGWRVDPAALFEDDAVSGGEFANRPGLARLLVIGVQRYFDHGNHENVRRIVGMYVDGGYPFEPHLSAINTDPAASWTTAPRTAGVADERVCHGYPEHGPETVVSEYRGERMSYEWQAFEPISASAAELISSRDPRQFSWGYYARDDCKLASAGSFSWFSSVDELLAFLVEVEPLIYLDPEEEDEGLADIRNDLRAVCDRYRGQPDLPPEFIDQINQVLAGLSSLEWAGKLADLSNGRGSEFAQHRLEEFCEAQDEGVDIHAPVTEGELDDFIQHLFNFGH